MESNIDINSIYVASDNVVAREIEGEIIIVPLIAGIGDMEDELYTLNETGRVIWSKLNGEKNLKDVARELAAEYAVPSKEIEKDVVGLVEEMFKRKIIVKII